MKEGNIKYRPFQNGDEREVYVVVLKSWRRAYGERFISCNNPTSDAGKECTDSNQCKSYCQASKGTQIDKEVTGNCYGFEVATCMQEVRNGIADATWCE